MYFKFYKIDSSLNYIYILSLLITVFDQRFRLNFFPNKIKVFTVW